MQKVAAVLSAVWLLAMTYAVQAADRPQVSSSVTAVQIVSSPSEVKWGPAPPVVPSGAQAAVLDGDPFKDGACLHAAAQDAGRLPDRTALASY